MYTLYCQNKPKSEALRMSVGDSNPFFKECQSKLGHKLPLGAYLLKPVQRITKYQLLLKVSTLFSSHLPHITFVSCVSYLYHVCHIPVVNFQECIPYVSFISYLHCIHILYIPFYTLYIC